MQNEVETDRYSQELFGSFFLLLNPYITNYNICLLIVIHKQEIKCQLIRQIELEDKNNNFCV